MSYKLSELAQMLGATWEGGDDPVIEGAAGIADAGPGQLTFAADHRRIAELKDTRAAAAIIPDDVDDALPEGVTLPVLRCDDSRAYFTRILELFAPPIEDTFPAGVHPTAVIHESAVLGKGVAVGPQTVIGPGVKVGDGTRIGPLVVLEKDAEIGSGCMLHAHTIVRERCRLGNEIIIHAGAVIGSDGFGYHAGPEGLVRIPQIGIVVLEDRVEIGANSCVDRATTGETRIGYGTKIDNQVQVAHNVRIGRHTAISAQTGISGSCVVGDGVTMGGQVGMGDHLTLGDGVKVAAKSGLTRDVAAGKTVFGYPAVEFNLGFRLVALTHRLPEFMKRLARIEKHLGVDDKES